MYYLKFSLRLIILSFLLLLLFTASVLAETPVNSNMANLIPEANLTQTPVKIIINGEEKAVHHIPFVNADQHAMISLSDAVKLFGYRAELADSNQVHLYRNDKSLIFRINEHYYFSGDKEFPLDAAPFKQMDEIFLPLYIIAQDLNYEVTFRPEIHALIINQRECPVILPKPTSQPEEKTEDTLSEFQLPQNLPRWGTLAEIPEWSGLWPDKEITAGYFTNLFSSPPNRTSNIILSCQSINETILNPGEIFSFNQIVGIRTATRGYREAPIFVGKKVVPGVGGGICQTASTLYNCALQAGLPIKERYRHTLKVTYVPHNMDATVSWGGADLKFINNKDYPVKILTTVYENYLVTALARAD